MTLSSARIKFLQSLQLKKYRQKYNKFTVEGDKICREVLQNNHFSVSAVIALDTWLNSNTGLLRPHLSQVEPCSEKDLERISALKTPNQVLLVLDMPASPPPSANNPEHSWVLYLDDIRDPGNLGTILRIADWFGISRVFCSPTTAEWYNQKVIQASMGAFLRVGVEYLEPETLQQRWPHKPWFTTSMEGRSVFEAEFPVPGVLVIGNESQGVSPRCQALATESLAIPAPKGSGAESLNAAVATGIFCAIITRS